VSWEAVPIYLGLIFLLLAVLRSRHEERRRQREEEDMRKHIAGVRPWWGREEKLWRQED